MQKALQCFRGDNHGKNDDAECPGQSQRQAASRGCAEAAWHPDGNRHGSDLGCFTQPQKTATYQSTLRFLFIAVIFSLRLPIRAAGQEYCFEQ